MPDYCVVEALHTEWPVAGDIQRQECLQQGGVIVSRGGSGCGSEAAASRSYQGFSDSGIAGRTSALALVPLRLFRTTFAESPLTAQLDRVNSLAASEIDAIFTTDPALGERVRDAFLKTSLLAASFIGSSDEDLSQIYYTQELHDELAEVARAMALHARDDEVRAALEGIAKTSELYAGKSLREIKEALNESTAAA